MTAFLFKPCIPLPEPKNTSHILGEQTLCVPAQRPEHRGGDRNFPGGRGHLSSRRDNFVKGKTTEGY